MFKSRITFVSTLAGLLFGLGAAHASDPGGREPDEVPIEGRAYLIASGDPSVPKGEDAVIGHRLPLFERSLTTQYFVEYRGAADRAEFGWLFESIGDSERFLITNERTGEPLFPGIYTPGAKGQSMPDYVYALEETPNGDAYYLMMVGYLDSAGEFKPLPGGVTALAYDAQNEGLVAVASRARTDAAEWNLELIPDAP